MGSKNEGVTNGSEYSSDQVRAMGKAVKEFAVREPVNGGNGFPSLLNGAVGGCRRTRRSRVDRRRRTFAASYYDGDEHVDK